MLIRLQLSIFSLPQVTRLLFCLVLLSPLAVGQEEDQPFQDNNPYSNLEDVLAVQWEDLMSEADLQAILNAPPMSHDFYGWEDQLAGGSPEEVAYMKALQSYDVNPELINKRIVIPGFIVPTAFNEERRVTEFFLVPFFGACIHLPPPPPNQIIYVTYESGIKLETYYEAYYVMGELSSKVVRNDLANSAYSLSAEGVEIYTY
ncbi:MAG: DUF3299 domain-containing protein [Gammaproteobacteria bacterium]|nr:DUF3299 domain-containing protein [Gammaproteobacteria bacterium]